MVITHPVQVTPHWLTETLQQGGFLTNGQVEEVAHRVPDHHFGATAHVAFVTPTYSANATGQLPASLFLKMADPQSHREMLGRGKSEVAFYRAMSDTPPPRAIPICYSAEFDPETRLSHFLLEDLSTTHFQRPMPLAPSLVHCEQIVAALATHHAHWWNSPRIESVLHARPTEKELEIVKERLWNSFPAFMDYVGDTLLPYQRQLYEKLAASDLMDRVATRLLRGDNITVVHGDSNLQNFMLPRDRYTHHVIILDWQLWGVNIATSDLAFLIAKSWSRPRREVVEQTLLRHYHRVLTEQGINYSWDALWHDYRTSVLVSALIPVGQVRRKQSPGLVFWGMENTTAACMDLGWEELL